jgi:hypothetical protein
MVSMHGLTKSGEVEVTLSVWRGQGYEPVTRAAKDAEARALPLVQLAGLRGASGWGKTGICHERMDC